MKHFFIAHELDMLRDFRTWVTVGDPLTRSQEAPGSAPDRVVLHGEVRDRCESSPGDVGRGCIPTSARPHCGAGTCCAWKWTGGCRTRTVGPRPCLFKGCAPVDSDDGPPLRLSCLGGPRTGLELACLRAE